MRLNKRLKRLLDHEGRWRNILIYNYNFIMIEEFRIRNLRSIKDSGSIRLSPITLLLGTNSSGKSTFLRSFPLFSQSVSKHLRGPIAWFDNNFVDFGDFRTAKNKYADVSEGIVFSYSLSHLGEQYRYRRVRFSSLSDKELKMVHLSFGIQDEGKGTFVNSFQIRTASVDVKILFNGKHEVESIYINGTLIDMSDKMSAEYSSAGMIVPMVYVRKSGELLPIGRAMFQRLIKDISTYCSRRFKNEGRLESILRYESLDKEGLLARIKSGAGIKFLRKNTSDWDVNTPAFVKLYNEFVLLKVNYIVDVINHELSSFYDKCDYIAPLRADMGRYYRVQGLQVQSVDSSGHNLIEFVSSLSNKAKEDFDDFISPILGITIEVPNELGMKSLKVRSENGEFNIADVGYGYSQILPIITKLWHVVYQAKSLSSIDALYNDYRGTTLLIEQPELHLHPAMQATLADVFAQVVEQTKELNYSVNLIVETHSPTIINRLGRRLREKKYINSQDVNVLLFQKDSLKQNSVIKQVAFNENGQIIDWPYGFFDPED